MKSFLPQMLYLLNGGVTKLPITKTKYTILTIFDTAVTRPQPHVNDQNRTKSLPDCGILICWIKSSKVQ